MRLELCGTLLGSALLAFATQVGHSQSGLQVTFGGNGLETLSYNGQTLEDVHTVGADAFHIWHMRATDLHGKVLTEGQYGWGETNNGRHWDGATHTWTYQYSWGTISTQYVQHGDDLNLVVTTQNKANSGVVFSGASIYPLALHFPSLPEGFANPSYPQLSYNTTGPSVTLADYGRAEVFAVVPEAGKPLYSGFMPTDNNSAYTALISSTVPDGLAVFQPHHDRPVKPGETDRFEVALRFRPAHTPTASVAQDAYTSWSRAYPATLHWTDRRPIGTVFLATSPQGDEHHAGGFSNNPRRYFTDANAADFDVHTPAGLEAFQRRVLRQAETNITNLKVLGAQGAITWDIEGEEFPQETSYACAPDEIAQIAPEMETTLASGPYKGMKLDDAYFKQMRDAGFRVGVCIRPQHFTLRGDGTAQQAWLPTPEVASELMRKIRFAHDRWGATLFYIDSTVDETRGTLPAAIFKQVAAAFPDSLLIPEESTPLYYAYTAPFESFIFHGTTGTDPDVRAIYPQAFSALLVNNVAPDKLEAASSKLTTSVHRGDVLMGQVDYREPNNARIVSIYAHAKSEK